jgi:hypothetical protein
MASFLDALQDMKDTQRMIEAAKTGGIFAALDAQQKMRERQQLRDLAANSEASLALQREAMEADRRKRVAEEARMQQIRLEAAREQARLQTMADALAAERARQEAEQARHELERRRRDALPKCPECHSPIEGSHPRKCATCRSDLYWLQSNPLARGDAMALASNGWLIPEVERCRDQLTHAAIELAAALCMVRDAGIGDVSGCKDALAKRTQRVQALEKRVAALSGPTLSDDPLNRQRYLLEQEISAIRSRVAEIREQQSQAELDFSSGAPALRARLKQSLKTATDKAAEITTRLNDVKKKLAEVEKRRAIEAAVEAQRLRKQVDDFKKLPPALPDLQAVCNHARNAEIAVASVAKALELIEPLRRSLGGDTASMPSILENGASDEASLHLKMPTSGEVAIEVRLPSDAVAHQMNPADLRQWTRDVATGVEVVRAAGATDWVPIRKALPTLFVPMLEKARIERLMRTGIDLQPGKEKPLTEDAIVDLLLPGMCAVAAADGVLQSQERSLIVELMCEKGCSEDRNVLEAKVVDTCRRIHKDGLQAAAEDLCQRLRPFIGRPVCDLFLELLQRIAAADGRMGSRESAILDLFRQRLAVS